jgi:hypothetical protein
LNGVKGVWIALGGGTIHFPIAPVSILSESRSEEDKIIEPDLSGETILQ